MKLNYKKYECETNKNSNDNLLYNTNDKLSSLIERIKSMDSNKLDELLSISSTIMLEFLHARADIKNLNFNCSDKELLKFRLKSEEVISKFIDNDKIITIPTTLDILSNIIILIDKKK